MVPFPNLFITVTLQSFKISMSHSQAQSGVSPRITITNQLAIEKSYYKLSQMHYKILAD